ncbi:MAG: sugar transferase [Candidatus Magasanikbacteria bacterium]|nr:sugar transferase [Candidatus Magasanikbacteria bacterium]
MPDKIKKFAMLLGDIAILYFSLYLKLLFRYREIPNSHIWNSHFTPFSLAFVGWILIFYISNLYNLHLAVNTTQVLQLTMKANIIAAALSALFFYINPSITIAPKTNLVIFLLISFVLIVIWRRIFNWLLYSYSPKQNIAVIGYNEQVKELINIFNEKPYLGYNINLIFSDTNIDLKNITISNEIENLKKLIEEKKVSTIILASDLQSSDEMRSMLFSCLPLKVNFVSLPNFYETITGKVPIEAINKMWFLENLNEGNKTFFNFLKRFYDIILALVVIGLTIIFWLPIALIIKLESKGPVFFKMKRYGKNKTEFSMLKFRTMREDGNTRAMTVHNDPRITRFGNFMRKTRIDELPQAINILKGEMSFVGPRPERPELADELEKKIPFFNERMLVKPGVTGADQVSGEYHSPTEADTLKKLQYDLFYIKNRSIYLDFSIILKTIATVLGQKGR